MNDKHAWCSIVQRTKRMPKAKLRREFVTKKKRKKKIDHRQ